MVDNRSESDGGFSFPDVDNGVARDCLISVKQTEYTEKHSTASGLSCSFQNKINIFHNTIKLVRDNRGSYFLVLNIITYQQSAV